MWYLVGIGLLIESLYIGYTLIDVSPAGTVLKYIVIYASVFGAVAAAAFLLKKEQGEDEKRDKKILSLVLVFSVVFGLTLVSNAPGQSDDIYRYIWDGKMYYHGVNPYRYAPQDKILEPFHSKNLPRLVNFPYIKTIYPPVAQMVFQLSYRFFGESVAGLKFFFLMAMWVAIFFFYRLLKRKQGKIFWLPLFAWNPLVVMETAVNGHLDILMVSFLLAGLWFFYSGYLHWSGVVVACSILTKLIPVVLLPVFLFSFFFINPGRQLKLKERWLNRDAWKKTAKFFIPLGFTIGVFYYPFFGSASNMFLTAMNYSSKWYFNNPFFYSILNVIDHPDPNPIAHFFSFGTFIVLFLVFLFYPHITTEQRIFYIMASFVICNPTIHPWYLIVLLSLLCLYHSMFPVIWSGLIAVSYIVLYRYRLSGVWEDSLFLMLLEYIPLLAFLLFMPKNIKSSPHQENQGPS